MTAKKPKIKRVCVVSLVDAPGTFDTNSSKSFTSKDWAIEPNAEPLLGPGVTLTHKQYGTMFVPANNIRSIDYEG